MATDPMFQIPINMYVQGSYFGDIEIMIKSNTGRDSTAEVEAESHFLFIQKLQLFTSFKNFPAIEREMHYVAGERKTRHEENIDIVRKKFAETKREIIREKLEERQ